MAVVAARAGTAAPVASRAGRPVTRARARAGAEQRNTTKEANESLIVHRREKPYQLSAGTVQSIHIGRLRVLVVLPNCVDVTFQALAFTF